MKAVITSVVGFYLGLEPGTTQPYINRSVAGDWEYVDIEPVNPTQFSVRFIAANRQFSIYPIPQVIALDSRPAGDVSSWETFYGTEQPDGKKFLYQYNAERGMDLLFVQVLD